MLVSALERGGEWQAAVRAFDAMLLAGVTPNAACYRALVSAYGSGGWWRAARRVRPEPVVIASAVRHAPRVHWCALRRRAPRRLGATPLTSVRLHAETKFVLKSCACVVVTPTSRRSVFFVFIWREWE